MTSIVAGEDVHPFRVTVTEYVPLIAVLEFERTGFCDVLVKPPGPLHKYVTPLIVELAIRLSVAPEQSGPLLSADGEAGAVGFTNVNGPIGFEGHPLRVAVIFEYVPTGRFGIVITPLAFDDNGKIVGLPPSLMY